MASVVKNLSWRFTAVWQRNFDVFLATWKTNLIPPLAETLLYIFGFGLGLGVLLGRGGGAELVFFGRKLHYIQFIVPGVLAISVMFAAFFECTYGSFIRMYYQKTFDAIISTPVMIEEVILGELVWGATRSVIRVALMLIVLAAVDLTTPHLLAGFPHPLVVFPYALLLLPLAFVGGLLFAGLGMLFTSVVPTIDAFNYSNSLLVTPLFLFSGAFFPLGALPGWAHAAAQASPLTHLTDTFRALALGALPAELAWKTAALLAVGAVLSAAAIRLMRRRLIV